MRTLIVGAGRLGRALAHDLLVAGDDVRVLHCGQEPSATLPSALEGRTLHGSPLDREILAGAVAGCDGLAATTADDALNAVVALAARRELGVPTAVAVVAHPGRAQALSGLGIHVHCPTTRTARDLLATLARSPADRELELGPDAAIYRVEPAASLRGRSLDELSIRGERVPVAVQRAGRVLLAGRDLRVEEGDVLHVAAVRPGLVTDLSHP